MKKLWSKYIFSEDIREKLEQILEGTELFVRDCKEGHPDGIYVSPKEKPRRIIAEAYWSAKGLTVYPSKEYLDLADKVIKKEPVFHEKYARQCEYFLSETELYAYAEELAKTGSLY